MTEFRYAKGRIIESLAYITKEMDEFDSDYAFKTYKDYASDTKLQKLVDRTIENILTAFIEVCGAILTEEDILAESYADVMRKAGNFLGFSEEAIETLAKLAIQRNRLAHRCLNFRWQVVEFYTSNRDILKKLLNSIYEYEKEKEG
ncbi:MAG: HepT-like ribonuclease domain-containing protein [Thermodesulfovibrionales bacterium]